MLGTRPNLWSNQRLKYLVRWFWLKRKRKKNYEFHIKNGFSKREKCKSWSFKTCSRLGAIHSISLVSLACVAGAWCWWCLWCLWVDVSLCVCVSVSVFTAVHFYSSYHTKCTNHLNKFSCILFFCLFTSVFNVRLCFFISRSLSVFFPFKFP